MESSQVLDTEVKPLQTEVPSIQTEVQPLDLSLLWEVIDKHRREQDGGEELENNKWELVIIQAVLLTLLILVALLWAVCCRRNCCRSTQDPLSVTEALRKLSKDLPPSYSRVSRDCGQEDYSIMFWHSRRTSAVSGSR